MNDDHNDDRPRGSSAAFRTGRVRIIGAEPVGDPSEPGVEPTSHSDDTHQGEVSDRSFEPNEPATASSGPGQNEAGLQHWTEAPTGEVPSVLARGAGAHVSEHDPWSSLPAPTWREEEADWAVDSETFEPSMLAHDDSRLGALEDAPDERPPWSFDLPGSEPPVEPDGIHQPRTEVASRAPQWTDEDTLVGAVIDDQPPNTRVLRTPPARRGSDDSPAGAPPQDSAGSTGRIGVGDPDEGIEALAADDPAVAGESGIEPPRSRIGRMAERGWRRRQSEPQHGMSETSTHLGGRVRGGAPRADLQADAAAASAAAAALARRAAPRTPPDPSARPSGRRLHASDHALTGGVPEHEAPVRRNLLAAVLTGVVLAAVVLVAFDVGTVAAMVVITVAVFLASAEAFAAFRKSGYQPATLLGLVASVSLMIATYNKGQAALPLVTVLVVAFTLLWYLAGVERGADPVRGAAATLLIFSWVAVFGSFAALLLNPALFPARHGIAFLLGALITEVAFDVGSLGVGSWIGRHPLAPSVSPHKTWEGVVGGAVCALLAAVVIVHLIHPWTLPKAVALGVVVSVVAPIGDLCESLVKRHLGLKDMGRLLPGHGGVLDRIDGLLFVLPATYYLVKAVHLG